MEVPTAGVKKYNVVKDVNINDKKIARTLFQTIQAE
jgi:hypothetical protein